MAAGDILAQMGQNVGANLDQYRAMQQADAAAQGQIHAFMGIDPQGQMLSPDGQQLLQKQLSGKANYRDRIALVGEMTTAQTIRQQQMELAMKRLQYQRLSYYSPGGPGFLGGGDQQQPPSPPQIQGGQPDQNQPPPGAAQVLQQAQPQPYVGNTIRPPSPLTVASPEIMQLMPKLLGMTMGDPEKAAGLAEKAAESINKNRQDQYNQAVAVEKPTGRLVFAGAKYDDNGAPTLDQYYPETVKSPGTPVESRGMGAQIISFPHGTKPPQDVVTKPGENTPTGTDDKIAASAPFNPNMPGVQKAIVQTQGNITHLQGLVAEADLLKKAWQAYAAGGASGLNVLRGDPHFSKIQQLFTGTNPRAALQTALSANTSAILNQIKNPNGTTTGGRVLQSEYQNMADLLGKGDVDNATGLASAYNNASLTRRLLDIESAKGAYLHQMPEGDADQRAMSQFGTVPQLSSAGAVQNVPREKVKLLQAYLAQKNPVAMEHFKQKYKLSDEETEIALLANAQ